MWGPIERSQNYKVKLVKTKSHGSLRPVVAAASKSFPKPFLHSEPALGFGGNGCFSGGELSNILNFLRHFPGELLEAAANAERLLSRS